ncbi:restriction modification system DNA specificity domain protein [Aliivibrio fischeri MJ11]|uniref:Restriction modification system DNA specificity domain protein n=1 Tax=Aliivibrio fischeri (strain MJ11) TaxID=388396 RepID=B5FA22_ALIFM|nr:restriction endonuclease subunit S [Aliivibrio fischeri]ACH65729.1 restriction modification system DNA specificity domain protein [Aliivibrio fischeri MJ11]
MSWVEKSLDEVLKLEYGKPLDKSLRKEGGKYPAYGANGIKAWSDEYFHDEETIVVGRKGSAGELTLTDGKFWPLDVTYFVKTNKNDYDIKFLYYLLLSLDLPSLATGVKPGINRNNVYKIQAKFPSYSTQKQVAGQLDKAFDGIEQARTNTEKNLQNARELFDSYLQQVFSECGEGWKKTTLNELCTKFEYGTSSKSSQEGEVPVIRMGNIQDGRIVMDKLVYSLNEEDNQKYRLNFNDVLFNRTNSAELVGKTAIYKSEERAIFAGYLIRIHRNEKLLNADYLNFYLNSPIARKYGEQVMSQSTNQANISGTKLKTYPISIPVSLEEQQSIVDKISTLKEKVEELEATHKSKLTALDELKQSLLQQAFTGQLTQG